MQFCVWYLKIKITNRFPSFYSIFSAFFYFQSICRKVLFAKRTLKTIELWFSSNQKTFHFPNIFFSQIKQENNFQTIFTFFCSVQTESALLFDSVKLFANALKDLDHSQLISMPSTSCTAMNPWLYGTSLMNYMRPVSFV